MMEIRSLVILYFLFIALATVYIYNIYINWPAIRAHIASDWSSPLLSEGFLGSGSENLASVLSVAPEPDMVAGKFVALQSGEPVKRGTGPYVLLGDVGCLKVVEKSAAADKSPYAEGTSGNEPNSEACYRHNYQACMNSRDGSYAQMTNNYMRTNPDSCTSPFHEFLGNFYKTA